MPQLRLQYNGDNQYTTKDKRMLLLTQEAIQKINNMSQDSIAPTVPVVSELPASPVEWQMVIDETDRYLKIYYDWDRWGIEELR